MDEAIFAVVGEPDGWVSRALDGRVLQTSRSPVDVFQMSSFPERKDRFILNLFLLGNGVPPSMLKTWWSTKYGVGQKELSDVDDTHVRWQKGSYRRYWDVTAQAFADQIVEDKRDWRFKVPLKKGNVTKAMEDLPLGPPRRFKRPMISSSTYKGKNPYAKKKGSGYNGNIQTVVSRPVRRSSPAKKISPVRTVNVRSTTGRSIPGKFIVNPYRKKVKAPMNSLDSLRLQYNSFK